MAIYLTARLLAIRLANGRNAVLAVGTMLILVTATSALVRLLQEMQVSGEDTFLEWGHRSVGGTVLRAEPGALIIAGVALGLGTLVTVYSGRYLALDRRYETYYPLLMLLISGLVGMVLAADLFNLYLFCELMSLAAYSLVSFRRQTDTAIEAGFKYLIMGSVGTVLVLLGISFVYRGQGHLALPPNLGHEQIPAQLPKAAFAPESAIWVRLGLACVMVGLAVKSAIVPLHTWLPDAHGRAPSSISAMLSGIVIQSALYTLIKVSLSLGFSAQALGNVLIVLSILNMTLGNGLALVQTHTKRLLAYSSIAQMGYVMFAIGTGLRYDVPAAIQAGFFLLVAHATMKGLAFLCKGVCHFYNDATTVAQLRGTYRQHPLVAVTFGLALAGLAGVPPLAGFAAKWFLLTRALEIAQGASRAGQSAIGLYIALAAFLVNSVVALGYWLPIVGALFAPLDQETHIQRTNISAWMALPLVVLGVLVVALGFYPGPWLDWTARVGAFLLGS
jgi:proton-translocating NADH-quinone oxidoreductase chain N